MIKVGRKGGSYKKPIKTGGKTNGCTVKNLKLREMTQELQ